MRSSRFERLMDSRSKARRLGGSTYHVRTHKNKKEQFDFTRPEYSEEAETLPVILTSPSAMIEEEQRAMETEITAANFVLSIENGIESDDFESYSQGTLDRATGFLRRLMIHAHTANVIGMGIPQIGPADRGSIDLYWEKNDRTLLINFPAAENIANFYGKKAKSEISGRFEPSEARAELVFWLVD